MSKFLIPSGQNLTILPALPISLGWDKFTPAIKGCVIATQVAKATVPTGPKPDAQNFFTVNGDRAPFLIVSPVVAQFGALWLAVNNFVKVNRHFQSPVKTIS
jgi:hypothetical protein